MSESQSRPIEGLALPPSSILPLRRAGYDLLNEIPSQSAEELSQALRMSSASSQSLHTNISTQPVMQSAASLASRRRGTTVTKFSTQFKPLDDLLDGGLPRGHVLELSGPPGTPKEKIATGVVKSFLSAKEEILFVDFQNMTRPTILKEALQNVPDYDSLVSYLRLPTLLQFMTFIHNLGSYILSHPTTSLLVLNSISFLFQGALEVKNSAKPALFDQIKQSLLQNCAAHNLTVVITSQLATKLFNANGTLGNFDTGAKGVLVPQLGPSYLPAGRTYRVILSRETLDTGLVRVLSSPVQKEKTENLTATYSVFDD